MIATWALYIIIVGALISLAAVALERFALLLRRPVRWVWLCAMLGSVAVPLVLSRTSAPLEVPIATQAPEPDVGALAARVAPAVRTEAAEISSALHSLDRPLLFGWALGSLALIGLFVRAWFALRRARQSWLPEVIDGAAVLVAPDAGPAVVGLQRPRIVVPRWILGFSPELRHLILRHEEEHLRARDSQLLLGVAALLVVFPWHAALWFQLGRLRLALELDCDARVLRGTHEGERVRTYASLLLEVGRRRVAARSIFAPALSELSSLLERRILVMTTAPVRRPVPRAALLLAATAGAALLACEVPRPEPLAPNSEVRDLRPGLEGDADLRRLLQAKPAKGWQNVPDDLIRDVITLRYPEVLRGDSGVMPLWFVFDHRNQFVATTRGQDPDGEYGMQELSRFLPQVESFRIEGLTMGFSEPGVFGPGQILLAVARLLPPGQTNESRVITFTSRGTTFGKVTGILTDSTGQPIGNVELSLRGTGFGAVTQINGRYFLIGVPPGTYTLEARLLYGGPVVAAREVTVRARETSRGDLVLRSNR